MDPNGKPKKQDQTKNLNLREDLKLKQIPSESVEIPTQSAESIFRQTIERKRSDWINLLNKFNQEGETKLAEKVEGFLKRLDQIDESTVGEGLDPLAFESVLFELDELLMQSAKIDLIVIKEKYKKNNTRFLRDLYEQKDKVAETFIDAAKIPSHLLEKDINGVKARDILEFAIRDHMDGIIKEYENIGAKIEDLENERNKEKLLINIKELNHLTSYYEGSAKDFYTAIYKYDQSLPELSKKMGEIKEYIGNLDFIFNTEDSLKEKLNILDHGIPLPETERMIEQQQRGIIEKKFTDDLEFLKERKNLPIETLREVTEELRHKVMTAYTTDILNSEIENEEAKYSVAQVELLLNTQHLNNSSDFYQEAKRLKYTSGTDGRRGRKKYESDKDRLLRKIESNNILRENTNLRFLGESTEKTKIKLATLLNLRSTAKLNSKLNKKDAIGEQYEEIIKDLATRTDWEDLQEFKRKYKKADILETINYLEKFKKIKAKTGEDIDFVNEMLENNAVYELRNVRESKEEKSRVLLESRKEHMRLKEYRSRDILAKYINYREEDVEIDESHNINKKTETETKNTAHIPLEYFRPENKKLENIEKNEKTGLKDTYQKFERLSAEEIAYIIENDINKVTKLDPEKLKLAISSNPNTNTLKLAENIKIGKEDTIAFFEKITPIGEQSDVRKRLSPKIPAKELETVSIKIPEYCKTPEFAEIFLEEGFNQENPNINTILEYAEKIPKNNSTILYLATKNPKSQKLEKFRKKLIKESKIPKEEKTRETLRTLYSQIENKNLDSTEGIESYAKYIELGTKEKGNPLEITNTDLQKLSKIHKEKPKQAKSILAKYTSEYGVSKIGLGFFNENSQNPEKVEKAKILLKICEGSQKSSLRVLEANLLNILGTPIKKDDTEELYKDTKEAKPSKESVLTLISLRYGVFKEINPSNLDYKSYQKDLEENLAKHAKQIGHNQIFRDKPELLEYIKEN